ncbi:MAG TPA: aminodeoxychorismate/anthranilate synthase component II [Clostridiales bacterium]|nr:aminodeoxychorismate/anthranilate synthase component II [Clostridiales bacterium]
MFLMVDNIDSFVWNLVRYLQIAGAEVRICRNDQLDFPAISQANFQGIVLSPGPGIPAAAGRLLPLIRRFRGRIPILGVCLGHQAIAEACGARIICSGQPMHGKLSLVRHDGLGIFRSLPNPLTVTRYHSLIVDPGSLPPELIVSCEAADGTIMGLRDESGLLEGVQFHPEAVLTEHGLAMIRRFVHNCRLRASCGKTAGYAASD